MRPGLESTHPSKSDHAGHESGYQENPQFKERVSKICTKLYADCLSSKDVYESEDQFA